MPHIRRLILLAALVVTVAAAVLAWQLASRVSAERLHGTVVAELEELLGEPVQIGSVGLGLRAGLAIVASDLRTRDDPEEPALEADHAVLVLSLRDLLWGAVELRRIELSGVRARVAPDSTGRWRPALVARLRDRATEPPATPPPGVTERLAEAARFLLEMPPGLPALRVDDAEVLWSTVPLTEGAAGPWLGLRDVQVRLGRRPFGAGLALRAHAEVVGEGLEPGRISVAATLPARGGAEVELDLADVDLGLTARVPGPRPGWLDRLEGRASGTASWEVTPPHHHEVDARLAVRGLRAALRGEGGPLTVETPAAEVTAELTAEPDRLELARLRLDGGGGLAAELGLGVDLPVRDDSRLRASISLSGLPLAGTRDAWRALTGAAPPEVLARAVAGRVDTLHARVRNTRLARLRALARDPLAHWPGSAAVDIAVADGAWRLPGERTLTAVNGRAARTADRVTVSGLTARLDEQTLPRLDLIVEGVPELARAAHSPRAVGAPGLPGVPALERWQKSRRKPGEPPSWIRAELEAPYIDHPALVWPLTGVRAVFEPVPDGGGNYVKIAASRWGGVPMRAEGVVGGPAPGGVSLTVELGEAAGEEAARAADGPVPASGPWGRARLDLRVKRLGRLPADRLRASLEARGTAVHGTDVSIDLRPTGEGRGTVRLELAHGDRVPFDAALAVRGAPLGALLRAVGGSEDAVTGRAELDASLSGRLRVGDPILAGARGEASLRARDGEIRRRLPALVAMATASDAFNPFAERETIPYRELDARARIVDGRVEIESLKLDGPALRLVASGALDPLAPGEPTMDLEVGVFFFPNVDWVIGNVPLVNRMVLGKDQNLVSGYFRVRGPVGAPEATLIPTKSITAGPGSVVLEAVPDALRAGVGQIRGWFGGGEDASPDGQTPPETKR